MRSKFLILLLLAAYGTFRAAEAKSVALVAQVQEDTVKDTVITDEAGTVKEVEHAAEDDSETIYKDGDGKVVKEESIVQEDTHNFADNTVEDIVHDEELEEEDITDEKGQIIEKDVSIVDTKAGEIRDGKGRVMAETLETENTEMEELFDKSGRPVVETIEEDKQTQLDIMGENGQVVEAVMTKEIHEESNIGEVVKDEQDDFELASGKAEGEETMDDNNGSIQVIIQPVLVVPYRPDHINCVHQTHEQHQPTSTNKKRSEWQQSMAMLDSSLCGKEPIWECPLIVWMIVVLVLVIMLAFISICLCCKTVKDQRTTDDVKTPKAPATGKAQGGAGPFVGIPKAAAQPSLKNASAPAQSSPRRLYLLHPLHLINSLTCTKPWANNKEDTKCLLNQQPQNPVDQAKKKEMLVTITEPKSDDKNSVFVKKLEPKV